MLKRALNFAGFLILCVIILFQSRELPLFFYVLFPSLIFGIFIYFETEYRPLLLPAICAAFLVYVLYLLGHPLLEVVLFGIALCLLVFIFWLYRREWRTIYLTDSEQCEISLRELDVLKQKYNSRLESLHHLEKQVAGLLDLFEIARDFNDCLIFDEMVIILGQKVMPELPFERMRLIILEKGTEIKTSRILTVSKMPTPEDIEIPTPEEAECIEKGREVKKLIKKENELIFPLFTDGELAACLIIQGTQPDDLAKFEVLAAYMNLQIKKVRLYETVKELSIRDGLTGVFVRRHFKERFEEELKRSIKYNLPLAVLMLDIDHFKRYNDDYGHLAGDATLKQVASLLRDNLRKVDIVGRYGGEEFMVIIPEARGLESLEVAERIRSNIARHNFKVYNDQTRVTVSIGISLFPEDVQERLASAEHVQVASDLTQFADQALYRAKEEGRNRVVLYRDL